VKVKEQIFSSILILLLMWKKYQAIDYFFYFKKPATRAGIFIYDDYNIIQGKD
jgi:hypothetical protein